MKAPFACRGTVAGQMLGAAVLATIAFFAPKPGVAQETKVAGMRTLDLPLLLDLPGDLAYVRYTPGSLDRSASVQARFELFCREFQRSGFRLTSLVLFVLSREDWESAKLATPYGRPQALGLDAVAVPGWSDEAVIESYRTLLRGEMPMPQGLPLLMTPAEAASLAISDLMTQLEVSRIFVRRSGIRGDRPWIEPLMAHVAARLAWDRYEPGRIGQIADLFDRLAANDPGPHRLDEWREDLPLAQQLWFEARFLRGADAFVTEDSPRKLWLLLHRALTGEKPLTEAYLLKKYPKLAGWKAANFAAN